MSLESIETVSLPFDLTEFDEIVDVRTPLEFAEDHLPGATNLPVLNNDQRVEIGTLYRRSPFHARRLGAAYISTNIAGHLGDELELRSRTWSPLVYCWRGGMRSRSFAHVLRSIGWRARVLEGGYKSWRRQIIADLDTLLGNSLLRFQVIAGLTGTGKTRLLTALAETGAQVLDLEALANHRGSLLGNVGEQPSQKRFESLLHAALGELDLIRPIFTEAESNRIGRVYVPPALWRKLAEGAVTELSLSVPHRVSLLLEEYNHFPKAPEELAAILDNLRKLRGHKQVDTWQEQIRAGQWEEFVASLLQDHYDLCYRRPGDPDSVYQPPSQRLELRDDSPESYGSAAARLLSNTAGALLR